ncbi:MAG: 3-deoxy-manno-octulosonate cytidylyltransferase [Thermoguttaceae bacterium]|nr:3-deoxy-manno-octulosonate cytidylyltransferase [Thermoguttaceae bacterium]MDW8078589.1 3-deoxy-manno-octulosonate cytidylyltransferase [Thermoguttaceae bacterium]
MSCLRGLIVIPARLHSTRLPRKMLLAQTGKPLVIHTWEAACASRRAEAVFIATDSHEIAEVAAAFGAQVILTPVNLRSGTDRVAQAVRILLENGGGVPEVVVNLQGDEPEIDPTAIDHLVDLLASDPIADMATLATPIRSKQVLFDPACVKVVFRTDGTALYFSRSPIPCPRTWEDTLLTKEPPLFWQHVGIYAYRVKSLFRFTSLPPADIEATESLEQLRALWHGMTIKVGIVAEHSGGIDTPADYSAFLARYHARLAQGLPTSSIHAPAAQSVPKV